MTETTSNTQYDFIHPDPCGRLEAYLYEAIPLVSAMQITVASLENNCLQLAAPLAPNSNHIGTGFGGSLQGLATLACWGVVWLLFDKLPTHIVVQESHMRFTAPAREDFTASCAFPEEKIIQRCHKTWQTRGKTRLALNAQVHSGEQLVGEYQGQFVALRV